VQHKQHRRRAKRRRRLYDPEASFCTAHRDRAECRVRRRGEAGSWDLAISATAP
jgi:hypothetical protein